ncbi:MAG: DUF4870 domain-containing protein [Caldisericum exile]|uniref:DUF4870 domain-containing protein n=1 Tax=Caldisericum exile TaxID=693075 RepID=UPI003C75BDE5
MEELKDFDPRDVEENKVIASLSYISILFLIPLLVKRDSKFCKEHAKQGLVLFIFEIALSIIEYIPILGWIIGLLGGIVLFVVSLIGFIYALQGKFWKIPIVYDLAQNFKF